MERNTRLAVRLGTHLRILVVDSDASDVENHHRAQLAAVRLIEIRISVDFAPLDVHIQLADPPIPPDAGSRQ
jgi:hypothetical protein